MRWSVTRAPRSRQPAAKYSAANAVTQSDDAFGGAVGLEAVGIYTETDVRGFNPQKAGNARIDGLYFDQMTVFPGRVRQSVELCTMYWHFLLLVWLILFGVFMLT